MPSTTFIPGIAIIQQYPHAVFDKLAGKAYEIWYRFDDEDGKQAELGFLELLIQVRSGDRVVGYANFTEDGTYKTLRLGRLRPQVLGFVFRLISDN
jgi:hypothetical protein